jgi:hypothetical protein
LSPLSPGDDPRLAVAQSQGPLLLFTRNHQPPP